MLPTPYSTEFVELYDIIRREEAFTTSMADNLAQIRPVVIATLNVYEAHRPVGSAPNHTDRIANINRVFDLYLDHVNVGSRSIGTTMQMVEGGLTELIALGKVRDGDGSPVDACIGSVRWKTKTYAASLLAICNGAVTKLPGMAARLAPVLQTLEKAEAVEENPIPVADELLSAIAEFTPSPDFSTTFPTRELFGIDDTIVDMERTVIIERRNIQRMMNNVVAVSETNSLINLFKSSEENRELLRNVLSNEAISILESL